MPLQREDVARAALRVLDEVGLDGLTMRRLAAELNIQGASLYWHFTNKQELINCMAEVIVADAFVDLRPPEADQNWTTWMAGYARLLRRMAMSHRDGARTLAEADLSLGLFMSGGDLATRVLLDAGFEARQAWGCVITVLSFVLGGSFEVQADPSHRLLFESGGSAPSQPPPVDPERFPTLARIMEKADLSDVSPDIWFEQGLRMLLDGMQVALIRGREY
jgi:TetR/AcrR family transcriptional regulator, tetracycline repressor protein